MYKYCKKQFIFNITKINIIFIVKLGINLELLIRKLRFLFAIVFLIF